MDGSARGNGANTIAIECAAARGLEFTDSISIEYAFIFAVGFL